MEVRVLDNTGRQLSRDELRRMNIWNDTLEHICATALERLKQGRITTPVSVEKTKRL